MVYIQHVLFSQFAKSTKISLGKEKYKQGYSSRLLAISPSSTQECLQINLVLKCMLEKEMDRTCGC